MKESELDFLLSLGCFRMQQEMFTCQYVSFDGVSYAVHWLRIVLDKVSYGPKQTRLFRINDAFSVTAKPFVLTREVETLYALYKDSVDFDAADSVEACLLDGDTLTSFDTHIIEVRDGATLIAAGIFDNGDQSIAGIMNFYHPAYRRQSLGKYLMLLKIEHARRQQKTYYYPGYIVSNYPKFDYKLFACAAATEVFDDRHADWVPCWLPFSWETVATLTADRLNGRSTGLGL